MSSNPPSLLPLVLWLWGESAQVMAAHTWMNATWFAQATASGNTEGVPAELPGPFEGRGLRFDLMTVGDKDPWFLQMRKDERDFRESFPDVALLWCLWGEMPQLSLWGPLALFPIEEARALQTPSGGQIIVGTRMSGVHTYLPGVQQPGTLEGLVVRAFSSQDSEVMICSAWHRRQTLEQSLPPTAPASPARF